MKRVSIGVFAVVAILSACSSGDNENEEPDLGDIGAVTSASDIVLPLATYMFNAEEDTVALRAYNQLLRECGRRFGVEVTMPVGANPPPEIVLARRYGIIDATEASQD
ncbi:MAG: hypothetical protein ACRDVZ_10935, partial [Jiangellaceae bacterium]